MSNLKGWKLALALLIGGGFTEMKMVERLGMP
jgi:hypothetical protein